MNQQRACVSHNFWRHRWDCGVPYSITACNSARAANYWSNRRVAHVQMNAESRQMSRAEANCCDCALAVIPEGGGMFCLRLTNNRWGTVALWPCVTVVSACAEGFGCLLGTAAALYLIPSLHKHSDSDVYLWVDLPTALNWCVVLKMPLVYIIFM